MDLLASLILNKFLTSFGFCPVFSNLHRRLRPPASVFDLTHVDPIKTEHYSPPPLSRGSGWPDGVV